MSVRLIDSPEFIKASRDFVIRKHLMPSWVLTLTLCSCLLMLALVSVFFGSSPDKITFSFAGILLVLFFISHYVDSRYKNLLNAIEFQNALFAGAARLATEFCLIVRHDGKIVYIDPEYDHKVFRLRNNNMRSIKTLLDAGEVPAESQEKLLAALNSGVTEKIPFKLPKTNRAARPLTLTLDPIDIPNTPIDTGNFTLSVRPLTRPSGYSLMRVQQEEFKKEYEEYLEDFIVGFYTIKNSGEFSYINSNLEQTLGYEKGDLISEKISISDLVFDQDIAKHLRSAKKDWQEIIVMRSRNNTPIYCFINQSPLRSANGKIVGKHGIIMPLNKDTIVEGEHASNSKTPKSPDLIKYSPIATALLDNKGNITDFNRSFRDFTEIPGKNKVNLLDLITKDAQDTVKSFFDDVITGKIDGNKPSEISIVSQEQENKAASLYLNRVTDAYGQLQGIIAHMIDTTELKNLEMRFVHSQKMQAVGQLAGGIAHDFNNLLTAMMGFCDLLLMRHPAGDQSFADIMQIKQNANRAANLVKQLLAFSRKQTLQPQIINITDSLADLSNLIGRLIGENIELRMVHGRDLKFIKVDQVQLEQVIINLAVNARDAMPEGGTLTIKTSNIVIDNKFSLPKNMIPPAEDEIIEQGEYVLIEVSDTGYGMNREIIGKIFEPFFSTKAIGSGTGLGLSTVYGIVKQTGGYIYISSKVSKGTKFSIFLKAYDTDGSTKPSQSEERDDLVKTDASDLIGSGNILLVEDETPVRIFSHNALINRGFSVLDADCAETALDIIKEKGNEIDVIITDVIMPGMSGPDMIKQISANFPNIKVIFISGYGEDAFVETYGSERSFNFLSKPYSLKQLVVKVKEVLEDKVNQE